MTRGALAPTTGSSPQTQGRASVYPRTRGGKPFPSAVPSLRSGSSPRGWGRPACRSPISWILRFIPAWTGQKTTPRVSRNAVGCSPAGAGVVDEGRACARDLRCSSTHAGDGAGERGLEQLTDRVGPRACGVARSNAAQLCAGVGASPRVREEDWITPVRLNHRPRSSSLARATSPRARGTVVDHAAGLADVGFIPARAGSPVREAYRHRLRRGHPRNRGGPSVHRDGFR